MEVKITTKMISDLRSITSSGLIDCKKALKNSNGNFDDAITYLKKRNLAFTIKKANCETKEGFIDTYVHLGGKLGVMLELNCQTDFVAKNQELRILAHTLSMQIAATNPICINISDLSSIMINKEREIVKIQSKNKPNSVIEKIIDGKMQKWYEQVCLMEQYCIKNPDKKIKDLINEKIVQMGENILVSRFMRYQIGEN